MADDPKLKVVSPAATDNSTDEAPMQIPKPGKSKLDLCKSTRGGADMLRLAAVRLCDAGIVPIMLVHDGILFEETDPGKLGHAIEIMRSAGRDVCNGLEIGVDLDQKLEGGARYRDKRQMAQKMWNTIMNTLQKIGALPRKDVA
jgi:hypothetical protein